MQRGKNCLAECIFNVFMKYTLYPELKPKSPGQKPRVTLLLSLLNVSK